MANETPQNSPDLFIVDTAEVDRIRKIAQKTGQKDQRRAADLATQKSVLEQNHYADERRLKAAEVALAATAASLAKALKASTRFPSHSEFTEKVSAFEDLLRDMTNEVAKLGRIAAGSARNLSVFMNEGSPSNADIITADLELEKAMQLVSQ